MFDPQTVAARDGIRVEVADLGDWGTSLLISEYDPHGPAIRINERAIERFRAACPDLSSCDVRTLINFAIAHELYHHAEAVGRVGRLSPSTARERAADAYARANVAVDARLDAFLKAVR